MGRLRFIFTVLLALGAVHLPAYAQYTLSENDDSRLRWSGIRTSNFRVIYPRGSDSLATEYLRELEKWRPAVSYSCGLVSGKYTRRPLDVVLHTRNAASNGMVTWAPSRMELNTIPQWTTGVSAMPWMKMLAIHEGRHAAQMQSGYRNVFKPFRYLFGEMIPGLACAYPGTLLLEGDAVVTETAFTTSGRGRMASFLNIYMYSFDKREYRDYVRWLKGSLYHDTPDNYSLGYLLLSAVRVGWDRPRFMDEVLDYVTRRPYDPWPMEHGMRRVMGVKFSRGWELLRDFHYDRWAADTLLRAPFMPAEPVSPEARRLTHYTNPSASLDTGTQIWVKDDIYHLPSLILADSLGHEMKLSKISPLTGKINGDADGNCLWNEMRRDPRWGQTCKSVIRSYSMAEGRTVTLTRKGWLVNPVFVDSSTIAAISYRERGGSDLVLLDGSNGETKVTASVPDTLQPLQITCVGDEIYAVVISSAGMGIWKTDICRNTALPAGLCLSSWEPELAAIPVQITSLGSIGRSLVFASDRNGSLEYYKYNIDTKILTQVSSTKYGADDYCFLPDGGLVFSQICSNGSRLMMTRAADLTDKPVQWTDYYRYAIADSLSLQEARLRKAEIYTDGYVPKHKLPRFITPVHYQSDTLISAPKPYRKGLHAFRFHSWAPCYVNLNVLDNLSLESVKHLASLGAMGFFQNTSSTLSGWLGYKAAPDAGGRWFHSGHINLTYTGLYPAVEASLDVNDRKAFDYCRRDTLVKGEKKSYLERVVSNRPLVAGKVKVYVPLSWNAGVLQYGVVPNVAVNFSNDRNEGAGFVFPSAGVRAYLMERTPVAAVYPRWGVGAEAQWVDPLAYFYMYGYVPGICCGQGLKLSALTQIDVRPEAVFLNSYANVLPRGFADFKGSLYCGSRFTADYAVPFYMGDWHIFEGFYCTRGILTPHYDHTLASDGKGGIQGSLFSAGASFELEFNTFFWIKTRTTLGITCSYNGGSLFSRTGLSKPYYIGALFSMAMP